MCLFLKKESTTSNTNTFPLPSSSISVPPGLTPFSDNCIGGNPICDDGVATKESKIMKTNQVVKTVNTPAPLIGNLKAVYTKKPSSSSSTSKPSLSSSSTISSILSSQSIHTKVNMALFEKGDSESSETSEDDEVPPKLGLGSSTNIEKEEKSRKEKVEEMKAEIKKAKEDKREMGDVNFFEYFHLRHNKS